MHLSVTVTESHASDSNSEDVIRTIKTRRSESPVF